MLKDGTEIEEGMLRIRSNGLTEKVCIISLRNIPPQSYLGRWFI